MRRLSFTAEDLKWLQDHGAKKLTDGDGNVCYEIQVSRLLLSVSINDDGYECDISQNDLYACMQVIRNTMLDAIKQCIKSFQSDVSKVNRSNSQLKKKMADLFGTEGKKK